MSARPHGTSAKLRTIWRRFRADRPGQRFQNLHRNRQEEGVGTSAVARSLILGSAIALVVVGAILIPAPGPGWLIIALGLGLLGCESVFVARRLDAVEVRLRDWKRWWTVRLRAIRARHRRGRRGPIREERQSSGPADQWTSAAGGEGVGPKEESIEDTVAQ